MGKRPSAKYWAIQKLKVLMADGEKRSETKSEARACGESQLAWSDGRMHSLKTREGYQKIILRFIAWCRDTWNIRDSEVIENFANRLATHYLRQRMAEGKSAWTLKTERSALRLFFQDQTLTERLVLPQRKREQVTRSRRSAKHDKHMNLANWQHVIQFCLACGLSRKELRDLYVREVVPDPEDGQRLVVHVHHDKEGKDRTVHVFPGREQAVRSQIEGRNPDAHVFERITALLDIQSYRRQFAQDLYELLSGKPLPLLEGRLHTPDLDKKAALTVSHELGLNRIEVLICHYLV